MLLKFRKHIPKFIIEKHLVYTDIYTDLKREKSCLVLTKQLNVFEYKYKELLNSINLQQSCLNKVTEHLNNYQGPYNKVINHIELITSTPSTFKSSNGFNINFGKYVFHYVDITRIYILIQCWDKLIALERLNDEKGFQLVEEYENVHTYKLIHNDSIQYCAKIEIKFQNGNSISTDFQKMEMGHLPNQSQQLLEYYSDSAAVRDTLERVCKAQSKLNVCEIMTGRAFHQVKQQLIYGLPHVRSIKLEEKQMLGRCGDIWKRLTPHNQLVLGIPLINQCCPPNLTILKNIQPVLQVNSCDINQKQQQKLLLCEYRLYQLQEFQELNSLDMFIQSDCTEQQGLAKGIWQTNCHLELLPNSFGVLVIRYHLRDVIHFNKCPLYITYEIVKDYTRSPTEEEGISATYSLQIFVQTIDFQQICFEERNKYEIKFNEETVQQDFLAIAMTSLDLTLKVTFNCKNNYNSFIELLQKKYDMNKIYKEEKRNEHFSEDSQVEHSSKRFENMSIPKENFSYSNFLLYNSTPNSLWYGLLLCQLPDNYNAYEHFRDLDNCNDDNYDNVDYYTSWFKVYVQSEDKSKIFLKSLCFDIISNKTNVIKIDNYFEEEATLHHFRFENFETTLSHELNSLKEMFTYKNDKYSESWLRKLENMYKLQLESDLNKGKIMNK